MLNRRLRRERERNRRSLPFKCSFEINTSFFFFPFFLLQSQRKIYFSILFFFICSVLLSFYQSLVIFYHEYITDSLKKYPWSQATSRPIKERKKKIYIRRRIYIAMFEFFSIWCFLCELEWVMMMMIKKYSLRKNYWTHH